jgi:DNA processing protein
VTDDILLALTFLESLPRVGLRDRLLVNDPELTELASPVVAAAQKIRAAARGEGIEFVPCTAGAYPAALQPLPDLPPGIWYRGVLECLEHRPAVAIVGSRAGSPVAIETAHHLAAGLAARGIIVVSGLARGVDSAAHRGALAAGGVTVAVLGSGLSRLYPAEHRDLADRIARQGVVLTEYPPAMPALPYHFPLRNRIISGLSRAVVVIEAAEKSGSLITAACALEQGKEVMVVPGTVLSGRNRGGHALLRDGAAIVESADDIISELGWSNTAEDGPVLVNGSNSERSGDSVLKEMQPGVPYDLDDLAAAARLDPNAILARLTALELAGRVKRLEGGRFVRAVRTC